MNFFSVLRHFLFLSKKNGFLSQDFLFTPLGQIQGLKDLVKHQFGVADACVLFKTDSQGRNHLQILVLPTNIHGDRFRKLQQRLKDVVGRRVDLDENEIEVCMMKMPKKTSKAALP